jgi:hypothetical protein
VSLAGTLVFAYTERFRFEGRRDRIWVGGGFVRLKLWAVVLLTFAMSAPGGVLFASILPPEEWNAPGLTEAPWLGFLRILEGRSRV